jgi:hypothetical protein
VLPFFSRCGHAGFYTFGASSSTLLLVEAPLPIYSSWYINHHFSYQIEGGIFIFLVVVLECYLFLGAVVTELANKGT